MKVASELVVTVRPLSPVCQRAECSYPLPGVAIGRSDQEGDESELVEGDFSQSQRAGEALWNWPELLGNPRRETVRGEHPRGLHSKNLEPT
jgi:hypothetical protein